MFADLQHMVLFFLSDGEEVVREFAINFRVK